MTRKPAPSAGTARLRRRAEQRLHAQHAKKHHPRIEADAKRLVHELQVHQVELELQNEELQRARNQMETLVEKFSDLYDFAPVGYFTLDDQGRILEVNLTGATLLGVDRSRLLHQRLSQFVVPEGRPILRRLLERVFAGAGKQVCEAKLVKAGGSAFWADFHAALAFAFSNPQRCCRVAVSDMSAFKQAQEAQRRVDALAVANQEAHREIDRRRVVEATLRKSEQIQRKLVAESQALHAQLRLLTREILQVQEEERKEISRELHDEIAQILAGINVQLATLASAAAVDPRSLRKRIALTQRLVEQSIETVHRFARELRPALLDDLGLIPALRSYIRDLPGREGLRIRFTASAGVETMDTTRRTVLFRVAQEALTNVTRHAHAGQVTVRLQKTRDAVRLEVRDDGRSFPVDSILTSNPKKRLGLLGMRERVEMVGGKLAIESSPGKGTAVRAEIPSNDHRRGSHS